MINRAIGLFVSSFMLFSTAFAFPAMSWEDMFGRGLQVEEQEEVIDPLFEAAIAGNVTELLTQLKHADKQSLTQALCLTNSIAAINALLIAGAKIEGPCENGMTPLQLKIHENKDASAMFLIQAGASPDVVNKYNGETALFEAVEHNKYWVARTLLDRKANVNAVSDGKQTPLDIAEGNGRMHRLLKKYNALHYAQLESGASYWGWQTSTFLLTTIAALTLHKYSSTAKQRYILPYTVRDTYQRPVSKGWLDMALNVAQSFFSGHYSLPLYHKGA